MIWIVLAACAEDYGGTHLGAATGTYVDEQGRVDLANAAETVEVRKEGDNYLLTVRGCTLQGAKQPSGSATVTFDPQPCEFDIPGRGPVKLTVNAHMGSVTRGSFVPEIVHAQVHVNAADPGPPRRELQFYVEPVYH